MNRIDFFPFELKKPTELSDQPNANFLPVVHCFKNDVEEKRISF